MDLSKFNQMIDEIPYTIAIAKYLSNKAEDLLYYAPQDVLWNKLINGIGDEWTKMEIGKITPRSAFTNGVYTQDDTEIYGISIRKAILNLDLKEIIPELPEQLYPDMRFEIAQKYYSYLLWYCKKESYPVAYSTARINPHRMYDYFCRAKDYGDTLFC